jgi:DNA-binding NarL/FixJ family response regulator
MGRARILLADDHEDMRQRTARVLRTEFEVVGEVADGTALLKAEAELKPDVCVLDISMPLTTGIQAATQLKARLSSAKVIFLTVHDEPDFVEAALAVGAVGYVLKSRMTSQLCGAVREALAGKCFVSPRLSFENQNSRK